MIALSRTRGFSAGNWQILLTNRILSAVLAALGVVHYSILTRGETAEKESYSLDRQSTHAIARADKLDRAV